MTVKEGTDSDHVDAPCDRPSTRQARPAVFRSALAEYGFCFSIILSQLTAEYFISGFIIVVPTLQKTLNISEASSTWSTSAFTLTAGGSLLIFGRLADMYGPQRVYILGLAWYLVWSVIAGFSVNEIMLDVSRAFQGFGPAAFLTSGVGLLGKTYAPGPRKNLVFAIYSGTAPLGYFFGLFLGGLVAQYLRFGWFFWIGSVVVAFCLGAAMLTIPWNFDPASAEQDESSSPAMAPKMDWPGAFMLFSGLVLFVFSITASGHAPRGWATPYVLITFVLGIAILVIATLYEWRFAKDPLLPLEIFKYPHMVAFSIAQFFSFGTFGVWLFYITVYLQNILHVQPLLVVAWFVPLALGGLIISAIGGVVLHRLPGIFLLGLSGIAWVIAPLLIALAPENPNYWAWFFPAMICGTLGIDTSYIVSSVFLTTTLPKHQQGLAGAFFNSLLFLGIAIFLGFADLTASSVSDKGLRFSYQAAMWFALACAAVALVVYLGFVRLGAAEAVDRAKSIATESDGDTSVLRRDTGSISEKEAV